MLSWSSIFLSTSKQRVPFDAARTSVSKNDSINAIKIKFIAFERIQMIIKMNRVLWSGQEILIKLLLSGIFIALSRWNRLGKIEDSAIKTSLDVYVCLRCFHNFAQSIICAASRSVAVDGRGCKLKREFMSIIISLAHPLKCIWTANRE